MYHSFGMSMPSRSYSASQGSAYRYGFNGKELDKEVASTTTYDYGFRIYSPGLGKFLSVDPLSPEYPWYTPYQFAGNMPIVAIDLDGLEEYIVVKDFYKDGTPKSISIYYTVSKTDPKKLINPIYKQVLGKNDDGSIKLADEGLTGQKVVRIVQTEGKDVSMKFDKGLDKEELNIVNTLSKNELPIQKDNDAWDMNFKGITYLSETIRDTKLMIDKVAIKSFDKKVGDDESDKIKKLNLNFNGFVEMRMYRTREYVDEKDILNSKTNADAGKKNGFIPWNEMTATSKSFEEKMAKSGTMTKSVFINLANSVKKDGTIKSVVFNIVHCLNGWEYGGAVTTNAGDNYASDLRSKFSQLSGIPLNKVTVNYSQKLVVNSEGCSSTSVNLKR